MRTIKWAAICTIAGLLAGTSTAYADDTGIYAGGSLGQSRTDFSDDILDDIFDGKDTAFKIFGGYRILDWLGVEAEYVDLGEITLKGNATSIADFRLEESGFAAFGVLYWKLTAVDLFVKGGLVASQAHVRASGSLFGAFDQTDNGTDLAYGIGGQVRLGSWAVRAEYERFELDTGNDFDSPELLSVGVTYTFF
jgi:outer membrane protein with beta-barrel domain